MIDHDETEAEYWKRKNAELTKRYEEGFNQAAEFLKVLEIRNANFALSQIALDEARERWRLEDAEGGGTIHH